MERWAELLNTPRFRQLAACRIEEARLLAIDYINEVAGQLPVEVKVLLPEFGDFERFSVSGDLADELDGRYFDLADAERFDEASHAFAAARFVSACVFLREASTINDLMDAVYEAKHALTEDV